MSDPYPPTGVPHVQGSDTSEAAAASVEEALNRLEGQVLTCLKGRGDSGATDDEIEQLTGMAHQTASARRRTLVLKGLVKDSGQRRKTRSGRSAAVWVLGRDDSEVDPVQDSKRPTDDQIFKALHDVTHAVLVANKQGGFEPSKDLRVVWKWLNNILPEGKRIDVERKG
jgi:hypothetical protein